MTIHWHDLAGSLRRRATSVLGGAVTVGVFALAVPALAASSTWHGALDGNAATKLSFDHSGSRITHFTIPLIGCTSINGYQTETISIPSIVVHGSRFSIKYHPPGAPSNVITRVAGTISGTRASGKLNGGGLCGTGPQSFHASLGAFKPATPRTSKAGACTAASCVTSDGALIKVTAVDRTIKSVADPSNPYYPSADPNLSAGVAVTIAGIDRSAKGQFLEPGYSSFKLRDGAGVLVAPYAPTATVVGQNGAKVTCSSPYAQKNLTRGAHFGPITICFPVASVSDREHLTLYYTPSSSKIPLG